MKNSVIGMLIFVITMTAAASNDVETVERGTSVRLSKAMHKHSSA